MTTDFPAEPITATSASKKCEPSAANGAGKIYCDKFKYHFDRGHFWLDNTKLVTILADPIYNALKRELKITIKYCPFCGANLENQK